MKIFLKPIINNIFEEFNKKKEEILPNTNEDDLTTLQKDIGIQTEPEYFFPNLNNLLMNKSYLKKKRYIKKPTGRKKKDDITLSKHNKYSNDNCIYKIKTRAFNFTLDTLNKLLIQQNSKKFFKRIEGKILKSGTKHHNLNLLNSKISTILTSSISKKYSKTNENINKELIEKYENFPLIKEILNMTFNDMIKTLYMLPNDEFQAKYSFESKYLFNNYDNCDERERMKMKNIIDYGLINHFESIKERKSKN